MAEQVQAPDCGHWTTKNPDGSVPVLCDYCFIEGADECEDQLRNGTLRLPPRIMKALIELPKKMRREAPRIIAEYRRQQELRKKQGE